MQTLSQCQIDVFEDGATTRLVLSGELDLADTPSVRAICDGLELAGVDTVLVDLSALDFMDSSGVHWLLHLRRKARSVGARTVVNTRPGAVDRVLDVTGCRELLGGVSSWA